MTTWGEERECGPEAVENWKPNKPRCHFHSLGQGGRGPLSNP